MSHGVASLFEAARRGEDRALARLISIVEDGGAGAREVARLVAVARRAPAASPACAGAQPPGGHVVGLTGAPGTGKSTLAAALIDAYRSAGRRVAVLAVDPSSPHSGGALLGDRVRMQRHALDPSVFIRSMSSRGRLGGLSAAVPAVLALLGVCDFGVVLLETVGVGQTEVEVAGLADTVVVLLAPGGGDAIQLAKAGVLEIADVLVVTKGDLDGAAALRNELEATLAHGDPPEGRERPPVLLLAAARGDGVAALAGELDAQLVRARASGAFERRRLAASAALVEALGRDLIAERAAARGPGASLEELGGRVLAGELDAYAAAEALLDG